MVVVRTTISSARVTIAALRACLRSLERTIDKTFGWTLVTVLCRTRHATPTRKFTIARLSCDVIDACFHTKEPKQSSNTCPQLLPHRQLPHRRIVRRPVRCLGGSLNIHQFSSSHMRRFYIPSLRGASARSEQFAPLPLSIALGLISA